MKQHLITAFVAGTVAIAATVGTHNLTAPPAAIHKASPSTWEGLEQFEIDSLTHVLQGLPPHDVAIFCSHGCDDLALDFDNALESAHWRSRVERPLLDDNAGLSVGPDNEDGRMLRNAIFAATHGRLDPKMIDAKLLEGRLALVISRKR